MFRKIAEAYAVLSTPESRATYDLSNKSTPEAVFKTNRDKVMEDRRRNRDNSGHVPGPKPARGSYAEFRLKELQNDRELHNVNHLGYYNGGVPRKGAHSIRGTAWAAPGYFHDPVIHNRNENPHTDTSPVNDEDVLMFNSYMNNDKTELKKTRPYYTLHWDKDSKYKKQRRSHLYILMAMVGFWFVNGVWTRESKRYHRTLRSEI